MGDAFDNTYFYIAPLLVFGPLFLWVFYTLGLRGLARLRDDIRRQHQREAEEAERFEEERRRKRGSERVGSVRGPNARPLGLFAQAVTYAWFAAVIGVFASSPPYAYGEPGTALVKLSLSHPGKRKAECRKLSAEEIAELPPNMRRPLDCPRERWPVHVELRLGEKTIFAKSARPAGLAADGPSIFYDTFTVPVGQHRLSMRLREHGEAGFDHQKTETIELGEGQVVAIEFKPTKGGFVVR